MQRACTVTASTVLGELFWRVNSLKKKITMIMISSTIGRRATRAAAMYRDTLIKYIAIGDISRYFFWHFAIQTCAEIDGAARQ